MMERRPIAVSSCTVKCAAAAPDLLQRELSGASCYGTDIRSLTGAAMQHYWHTLPGPSWFSAATIYKAQVARARPGAVFVEIGAWKGRSTAYMAVEIINSGKPIEFYTVDQWLGVEEPEYRRDPDVVAGRLFSTFLGNIAAVRDHVVPLHGSSTAAATRFADRSIDFVYLDADHAYAAVKADLAAWWPKLRPGGVIAGDDWCYTD